jgi:hypothetical protein
MMLVMRATVGCLVLGLAVASGSARADEAESAALAVPRIQAPPTIDGVLGDDEWRAVAPFELAYHTQPGDNTAPSERTEVRLAFDREYL